MPKWSSNSQTQMPSSPSSAGTPEPEKSQQPLPSAIMPSILTLMGSERAWPKATSRSTCLSGTFPLPPERTPFSSRTSILRLATDRFLSYRLPAPDEGAGQRDLRRRCGIAAAPRAAAAPGGGGELLIVSVGDLDPYFLEALFPQQLLVLVLLQSPGDAAGPRLHAPHQLGGELAFVAEEHHVGDREPPTRLEDAERL